MLSNSISVLNGFPLCVVVVVNFLFVFRLREAFNPFPIKPFLRVCRTSLLKTLWEKEKLLVTSNISFSRSVFYPFVELFVIFIKFEIVVFKLFQFGRVNNLSFGKELNGLSEYLISHFSHLIIYFHYEMSNFRDHTLVIRTNWYGDKYARINIHAYCANSSQKLIIEER